MSQQTAAVAAPVNAGMLQQEMSRGWTPPWSRASDNYSWAGYSTATLSALRNWGSGPGYTDFSHEANVRLATRKRGPPPVVADGWLAF
jgi:hypothetical protein